MIALLKGIILKSGGQISVSKIFTLLTAALATLIMLPDLFAQAGLAIPSLIVPYIKMAGILSAVITAFRLKWNIEKTADKKDEAPHV
jgi:hypothetical protein